MEADAKRLQNKEEELLKRKQEIRNHLTQLKKERRDLRNAVEAASGERLPVEHVRKIKRNRKAKSLLVVVLLCFSTLLKL